ncbi:carboxylesterase [Brevibacterium sanguinis]|uniref:Carboxylesterase n=2 Tax=Brevibacterium TaxID=1696 RepID=A0A366ILI5_9MICO|nr:MULTISPECIES: alpha/beta fold hydrolase [Brevibacterium]RBP64739.1 carboxylesterase [Brevibacterium sanguinis]RBP71618.1 carboxylesterase [Brevibacterium celere]
MEIDFTPQTPATAAYRRLRPGASAAVLFLHGITGSPAAWTPIARAIGEEGLSVSVPLLPGHGSTWQELNRTGWREWNEAAVAEYRALGSAHERVVVAGLSMGGALALSLGTLDTPPAEILVVNPALRVDSPLAPGLGVLKHLVRSVPAIGNDIAHPDRDEHAYERTPVGAVASFSSALKGLRETLWTIDTPITVFVSGSDNVVGPRSLALLRSRLPRTPRIVSLRRSRHVATLDHDAPLIAEAILESARGGTAGDRE